MTGETQHQSGGSLADSDLQWESLDAITEPGAYVCRGSGDLIRVPRVGRSSGNAELIKKHGSEPIYVVQVSEDPFIPISRVRLAAANLDIQIGF